ncbi:MAG: pilus assembly protein PilM [Planctomycetota bacterium]|nr:pilus assembly protein PilM [Planctomycetota bacterium]
MAFGWSKNRYSPIAVDFGADSLKLLQVVASDPPQLVAAAAAAAPEEARQNPAARQAFFAQKLPELLRSQPFKGRAAMCSIPAYQTLTQHIQIARVEHEDFDAQIGMHLRQRLNVDPLRMVIRHFEVAQVVRENVTKQEVICLAVARDVVMRHVETMQAAKLDVVGMHCEPLAIVRAFAHLFRGEEASRTTCFIDLGAATTKVVIAHGAEMVFAKTINAGGDHLTRHRAATENMSFSDAREARIREASGVAAPPPRVPEPVGAPSATGSLAMIEARMAAERRAQAASPAPLPAGQPAPDTLDCLTDELQLSVRYHQSLFAGRNIDKLVFLGGEAHHVSTCQKIARALRIGAQLGDPLARLVRATHKGATPGVDIEQPQPGWAVPLGLCLSPAEV